jgi:mRNA-degrading endonuclease toxin of MazEF toxin-antitoxin module
MATPKPKLKATSSLPGSLKTSSHQAERGRTKVATPYPFQVLLAAAATGLARDSKAQAEQVRSVAVCVGRRVGRLSPELTSQLDDSLRLHLAL